MSGLLLKDMLNLKRMARQYLLILVGMAVWGAFMKNASIVTMYVTLCATMLVLTSFSYDEYAHFEKYALTMPVTRDTLVKEKYVFLLVMVAGGTAAGLLLGAALSVFLKENIPELVVSGVAIGGVFLVVYSMIIPVIYKLGVEKARTTMVILYAVLFLAAFGAIKLLKMGGVMEQPGYLWKLLPVAGLALMALVVAVSYRVSLGIVRKKEW